MKVSRCRQHPEPGPALRYPSCRLCSCCRHRADRRGRTPSSRPHSTLGPRSRSLRWTPGQLPQRGRLCHRSRPLGRQLRCPRRSRPQADRSCLHPSNPHLRTRRWRRTRYPPDKLCHPGEWGDYGQLERLRCIRTGSVRCGDGDGVGAAGVDTRSAFEGGCSIPIVDQGTPTGSGPCSVTVAVGKAEVEMVNELAWPVRKVALAG